MITGYLRSSYTAPCRWYPGGPIGKIRFYFAAEGAQAFPGVTVFHPYSQLLELENSYGTGEITGKGLRRWNRGDNVNALRGLHYEGTLADHAGLGVNPF